MLADAWLDFWRQMRDLTKEIRIGMMEKPGMKL